MFLYFYSLELLLWPVSLAGKDSASIHSCHFEYGQTKISPWYVSLIISYHPAGHGYQSHRSYTLLFCNAEKKLSIPACHTLVSFHSLTSQINVVVLLGFMSFTTENFWLSLYMQNVLGFSPLTVAIHLLPQAIGGILVNIVAGLVLHRVNNKILTGIGALAYVGSALLLATMSVESSYWAFIFPSVLLSVIGADLQFNVANVSIPLRFLGRSH